MDGIKEYKSRYENMEMWKVFVIYFPFKQGKKWKQGGGGNKKSQQGKGKKDVY